MQRGALISIQSDEETCKWPAHGNHGKYIDWRGDPPGENIATLRSQPNPRLAPSLFHPPERYPRQQRQGFHCCFSGRSLGVFAASRLSMTHDRRQVAAKSGLPRPHNEETRKRRKAAASALGVLPKLQSSRVFRHAIQLFKGRLAASWVSNSISTYSFGPSGWVPYPNQRLVSAD